MTTPQGAGGDSLQAWRRCMNLVQRCSNMRQLKAIHALLVVHGFHHNNYALSKLIVFCSLSTSGSLPYASLLFRHAPQPPNAFIYNTLIRAHSRGPQPEYAVSFFRLMLGEPDITPDQHAFAFALGACANIPSSTLGRQVHSLIAKNGLDACDNFVQTGLVRVYAGCRLLEEAHQVFDDIRERDAIMWNVLMNGYLRSGFASNALNLFRDMLVSEVEPDEFCVATGITAAAHLGALRQGQWIHDYIRKNGLVTDVFIGTSLVDMYAKCGYIDKAIESFEEMAERNVFSWAAIIGAFAMHGFAKEAFHCMGRMQEEDGLRPDGVVLLAVLTACSHAGLKEEAYRVLHTMEKRYGIRPKHEHYSCMIDLLCRAGHLEEAFTLVQEMPMKPLASAWGTLLSGARIYRNIELAEIAAEELVKLEEAGEAEEEDGIYVQLSNAYLGASRREDARRVRMKMGSRGVKKAPGCSAVEVDGRLINPNAEWHPKIEAHNLKATSGQKNAIDSGPQSSPKLSLPLETKISLDAYPLFSAGSLSKVQESKHIVPTVLDLLADDQLLLVVGGGAAGVYAAIRAKELAPHLGVLVVEKGKFLSKVRISGGGRCNVTNGHYVDKMVLAEHYPRGHKELRGSFFSMHGPLDTMSWFSDHGIELKVEEDGRVFPVTNNSASVIDCLLHEAKKVGVLLQAGKTVTNASSTVNGKFVLEIQKRSIDLVENIEADYLLVASGSSQQGYAIARQLGHSIVDPVPSLFTFKVDDAQLAEMSGVTFPKVKATMKVENTHRPIPQLTQVGPMLVTHWGLSGPVILRLSAWGARDLCGTDYRGTLLVDFVPDFHIDDVKQIFFHHKDEFGKQKLLSSFPPQLGLVKRFWKYLLDRKGMGHGAWASISNNSLSSLVTLLKKCPFEVFGKGQFKDEFVTAGGVPLSEVSLNSMESKIKPQLFFAGEVLNVDGVTGGFNLQNAWTGGYIAGTSIGKLAADVCLKMEEEYQGMLH
ncbi:hypothetical protein H6P81_000259 [Aristolochia fimbriata]|uniref:FAD/NAD(P)-binding oxidoreductase family protein n=1 Tax=Aristolochia fimbriata TaxID=158543 RepID=A0AAV7F4U1_ARIFI|nr:hypothetical protein H6P81_000259 [Aristolochia fimbriata]